ncbi:carboxypeptidase-like regulatory domain-containing protein [Blastopirellula sp. J2-11]|uniref:carboxypeptidase-like regulatory domain-containing protein n=1 Tax=Blastopirellula sp. J2-11 TaxID=2943192 RepID=UPI0021C80B73|nr:carboxypeptidase-like regulatory domain-containing protein [Blastopirellula sp. J2-11]UUO05914.1 carboxypeptidase-like regulatory domain-containing protein [Blastopirellula sp. J2-11]
MASHFQIDSVCGRILALLILIAAVGCGQHRASDLPDLGEVSGTVTLDGKPLPEATVSFQSTEVGRMASGMTDSAGQYKLYLLNDISGAPLGQNDVYITTARPADDSKPGSGRPEKLPAIYHAKSTLSADVKSGANTFDFDLKSK